MHALLNNFFCFVLNSMLLRIKKKNESAPNYGKQGNTKDSMFLQERIAIVRAGYTLLWTIHDISIKIELNILQPPLGELGGK